MNYVYILKCADDTLYCGWTTDPRARLQAHNSGQGAKYTRSRRPVQIVYLEEFEDKHDALSREWHIKRMNREDKLKLINNGKYSGPDNLSIMRNRSDFTVPDHLTDGGIPVPEGDVNRNNQTERIQK